MWFVYNITFFSLLSLSVLNAFKFPLLIGIGLSSVIGLLSCLIGYCSSRWCCKKEVQETRRERRRLMSMEMDWRREMDGLILGMEGFWKGQIYSDLSMVNQNALRTEPSDLVLDLELFFF